VKSSVSSHANKAGFGSLERALGRAREELRQAAYDALSNGLEVLGDRLQGAMRIGGARNESSHRLREVIERDRALVASSSFGAREHSEGPRASVNGRAERTSELDLELDVPFVASGSSVAPARNAQPAAAAACDEPIRTRTMAKLLALQGHRGRSLSIYDYLIAKAPNDRALRAEAEAVRATS